jgi:hypothetical protein
MMMKWIPNWLRCLPIFEQGNYALRAPRLFEGII